MATTPVTPAPTTPTQTEAQVLAAALKSHTITMSAFTLVIVAAVLGVAAFLVLHTMHSYESMMAQANQTNAQYQASLTTLTAQWIADKKTIAANDAQAGKVTTQVVYRDKTVDAQIATVTAPTRTDVQVEDDVVKNYQFSAVSLAPDAFTFSRSQTQTFVATKLDDDRTKADLADARTLVGLANKNTELCMSNEQPVKDQLKLANETIEQYKKVAVKSKWQKIGDVALKIGLVVGGAALAHYL